MPANTAHDHCEIILGGLVPDGDVSGILGVAFFAWAICPGRQESSRGCGTAESRTKSSRLKILNDNPTIIAWNTIYSST